LLYQPALLSTDNQQYTKLKKKEIKFSFLILDVNMIYISFIAFFKNYIWLKIILMKSTNKNPEIEALFTQAEPWEKWESKLVFGSIIIAILSLAVLSILINTLILK